MPDPSLYSLLTDQGKTAYFELLDRDENSAGGGDVNVRWPSPLCATPQHRTVASELAAILGGRQYDYSYIIKYSSIPEQWQLFKKLDRAALESWVQDYDTGADRLAGLSPDVSPTILLSSGDLSCRRNFQEGPRRNVG